MSFVAAIFTFAYLLLCVDLLRSGYAQDVSNNAQLDGLNISICGEGQFECRNKECIQSELVCDGRADCSDLSDETELECSRPELNCPDYAFRCKYGACIDREVVCDGTIDCSIDGSDEDPLDTCRKGNPNGYGEFIPPSQAEQIRPCLLSFRPINGQWKLRQISDNDDFQYVEPPLDQELEIGSLLVYTCDTGYKLRGNSNVRCIRSGRWTRKPVCIEIRCRPLGSLSMMGNCTHASGRVKPCSDIDPVRPKTKAQLSCRPLYIKDMESSNARGETVECNENGLWVPDPIRCVPVCGIESPRQKSLATGGTTTNVGTFPWHATLYMQRNSSNGTEKVFRCGATVIEANLLLTAAHCLYDFDTSSGSIFNSTARTAEILQNLFVMTGNIHLDYDSPLHDLQLVRRYRVRNVHTDCTFRAISPGIYSGDIALVELEEPIEFTSTLLPVCLDKTSFNQQLFAAGANGRVTGLGNPATNESSRMLQTTTVPYVPNSQCATLFNTTQSLVQLNVDKFCTGYNNETDPCADNVVSDGSGLVYEIDNQWYLIGFVNQAVRISMEGGERLCDINSQLLYTNVSRHMTWIQQVISDLERFKYPPCSRYLPPFRLKTRAPPPGSDSTPTTTTSGPITTTTSAPITTTTTETTTETTITIPLSPLTIAPTNSVIVSDDEHFSVAWSSCLIIEQPANGNWRLHRDFCEGDMHCEVPESSLVQLTRLRQGSQLVFSCDSGYRIEGNADVYCRANQDWSSIPICIEIKCLPLNSLTMIATCSRFGKWVNCNSPVSPNTKAKVSCRSGYWAEQTLTETVECNMNGTWEPELSPCVPVCGATFHPPTIFEESDITTELYNFPWHATLYVQKNSSNRSTKDIKCGATLIQGSLLLTAAHCVYNDRTKTTEDPEKLFILMNNVHRHYASLLHDPHSVRRGTVKSVHINCKYEGLEGNYAADIALLELQEPFEFFNIQLHPSCLDFSGYNEQVLGPGAFGSVIGFGKTTTGVLSDVLQTITVPYISPTQCKNSNITAEKQAFITSDKFCAGYNNGTAVCLGDGGGGIFVLIKGLWFIMGLVSVDLSVNGNNGGNTCDGNAYTLYTKVSDYMSWILDVMFHLERYKSYPPCSRDPKF